MCSVHKLYSSYIIIDIAVLLSGVEAGLTLHQARCSILHCSLSLYSCMYVLTVCLTRFKENEEEKMKMLRMFVGLGERKKHC